MRTFRTVLEQKIWERRQTLEEFAEYAETFENAVQSARIVQAFTEMIAGAVKGELPPPHFDRANLNHVAAGVVRTPGIVGVLSVS